MKSILVFLRIIIVGILWGIIFTEGLRVIMLCNWHFDIFWPDHWRQFAKIWRAGWVVRAPKEWAFVLLIITYIPMLLTGWWTLSLVAWEELIYKLILLPYSLYKRFVKAPMTSVSTGSSRYGVTKRKSYKQIRPAGINQLRVPISDYGDGSNSVAASSPAPAYSGYQSPSLSSAASRVSSKVKNTDVSATIDHALFKFDDDGDDDFDLDIDSFEKADIKKKPQSEDKKPVAKFEFDDEDEDYTPPSRANNARRKEFDFEDDDDFETEKPRESRNRNNKRNEEKDKRSPRQEKNENQRSDKNKRDNRRGEQKNQDENSPRTSQGPVYDALVQKNYDVISNVKVGDALINFIGVSEGSICLCLVDKEAGDWLADEEMFNGEDPLWFSENSHRISPVCLLNNAYKVIKDKLEDEDFEQKIEAYVVVQMANIINADDMFEVWNDMNINVTRINRGAPKEIRLFSKTLPEADGNLSKKELGRLTKILKNL